MRVFPDVNGLRWFLRYVTKFGGLSSVSAESRYTTLILQKKMLFFCIKWYQQNYLLVKLFILCRGITRVFVCSGLKRFRTVFMEGLAANGSERNKVFIDFPVSMCELKAELYLTVTQP